MPPPTSTGRTDAAFALYAADDARRSTSAVTGSPRVDGNGAVGERGAHAQRHAFGVTATR